MTVCLILALTLPLVACLIVIGHRGRIPHDRAPRVSTWEDAL